MVSKVQLGYVVADGLFVLMGIFIIAFSVIVGNIRDEVPENGKQAARNLFYQQFPLTAGIVNAVFIFATFLVTLPGLATSSRKWLKLAGYMSVVCALYTMVLGLILWLQTLKIRGDFAPLFAAQSDEVKSLMQTTAAAAVMRGCATPISSFANVFLDNIFTALFGVVGFDVVFIMATACLLKERKERERFRHIDEKNGFGRI
ncbi:hypothetical protein N0V88_003598 [Collariella sp. IMI 366227]|nr:hypothetical protein N0V88_003598 [Collariella sp. IMI 366227]